MKPGASPIRRLYDWHKLIGLGSLGFLILLTVTGVLLAMPKESEAVLTPTLGATAKPPAVDKTTAFQPDSRVSVDQAVAAAQRALPSARLVWIETPAADHGAYRLRLQAPGDPSARFPHSFVWISPASGKVEAVTDARDANTHDQVLNWIHPLHDGSACGLFGRSVCALMGLTPLALLLLGGLRWRLRRMRSR